MTTLVEQLDPYDARLALRADGLLRDFNQAGVLAAADVHVAQRLGRLGREPDERVLLAAALAVRGARLGSVCVELPTLPETVAAEDDWRTDLDALPWPDPGEWLAACAASPLVVPGYPLQLAGDLLYLDRYWRQEQLVREELEGRASRAVPSVDPGVLQAELARLFPDADADRQRLAAATAVLRSMTVIAGGPGTGKTTTVARIIELLRALHGPSLRIALAAPTGKAAARLQEAVSADASTLHRLLGRKPGNRSRFRHDRHDRLPYDVVVVDETSMVSLTMMSRLMEAVRPEARLILVGDPDQLASVEAGAVLGDIVARPAPEGVIPSTLADVVPQDVADADRSELRNGVVRLNVTHRYGEEIGELAAAIRAEDPGRVLEVLRAGSSAVSYVETTDDGSLVASQLAGVRADVVAAAEAVSAAADVAHVPEALDALAGHRLLCAHRSGPFGMQRWAEQVERWLADALGPPADQGEWYRGQPLLVTANDYDVQLFNGDSGVVVDAGERGLVAAFARGGEPVLLSPARLSAVQTVHAMTVHRAQGSQFDRVTLVLPTVESRLLTRELLYTAVTRAQTHVRVIGSEAAVRRAVGRPVARASGLRR